MRPSDEHCLALFARWKMIDLSREKPITLNDARDMVPPARGADRAHLRTLLNWISRGARGPSGERVKLEALRLTAAGSPAVRRCSDLPRPSPPGRRRGEEKRRPALLATAGRLVRRRMPRC
jgi:hypothetical protein